MALTRLAHAIDGFRGLGDDQRGNLAMALGDLANARRGLGRYDQALAAGDESVETRRALGHHRDLAAALGQTANILMDAGRHAEAEARYGEALDAAERAGDLELQGISQQHLGVLQREPGQTAESVDTLRRALRLFQQSGDRGGEMQTCDLLGTA